MAHGVQNIYVAATQAAGSQDWVGMQEIERMVHQAHYSDFAMASRLGVDTSGKDMKGKDFTFTIQTGPDPGGAGHPAGDNTFSTPTYPTGVAGTVRGVRYEIVKEIDGLWADLSRTSTVTKTGRSAIQENVEWIMQSRKRLIHEGALSDGTSVLGTVASGGASSSGVYIIITLEQTVTGTFASDTRKHRKPSRMFKPNMVVDVWDNATQSTKNAVAWVVHSVDSATQITLKYVTDTTNTSTAAALAAGDAITRQGACNTTDGSKTQANIWGLRAVVSQTNPPTSRGGINTALNYAGLDRDVYGVMKCQRVGDSSLSPLSREKIRQALCECQDVGGDISVIFWNREVDAEWNALHSSIVRFDISQGNYRKVPGGIYTVRPAYFEGFNFDIIVDADIPEYCAFGLSEKFWEYRMTPSGWHFGGQQPGEGGSRLHYMLTTSGGGTDAYALVLVGYPQLICKHPGANFLYRNIEYTQS